MTPPFRAGLAALLATQLMAAVPASGASIAAADQNDGYSARVLDKVLAVWTPPALRGNFSVRLKVSLDGQGRVLGCGPVKASGMEALDSSACGAVRQAAPFGTPPYGIPLDVHMAFWTGAPKGKTQAAPLSGEASAGRQQTVSVEQRARERAEAIAQSAAQSAATAQTAPPARATGLTEDEMRLNLDASGASGPAKDKPAGNVVKAQDQYDARYRKYFSTITYNLRNAMFIPAETAPGTYYATVRLNVDAAGVIKKYALLQGSGDKRLDKFVLQGIRRAGSVLPPPAGLGNTLDITFTLVRR